VCKCEGLGYQFVYKKDVLHVGDLVVYFPEDSLIPDGILEKIGLLGKLSGKDHNRVKSVVLRGKISQGVVAPCNVIFGEGDSYAAGDDVTVTLGVIKYEPPEIFTSTGNLVRLPEGCKYYDIENANNHLDIVEFLWGREVVITEKLEGTNISITYNRNTGILNVNQHGHSIVELGGTENTYCKAVRQSGLIDNIIFYSNRYNSDIVTFYGEMIGEGIQKNIYGLKGHHIRLYDILHNGMWVDAIDKFKILDNCGVDINNQCVPILASRKLLSDFVGESDLVTVSNGCSKLNGDVLREGIVITPTYESNDPSIGRVIIKQRDPIYLSKSKI
jgi:RNA ligase (TIGR02306 family)